jgi:hypothetical protein
MMANMGEILEWYFLQMQNIIKYVVNVVALLSYNFKTSSGQCENGRNIRILWKTFTLRKGALLRTA